MTAAELARRIEVKTGVKTNLTKNVLTALKEVVAEEIAAGNAVTIPGIVKIDTRYKAARKKGQQYAGFGGEIKVAEKAIPEKIGPVKASVLAGVKKDMPRKGTKAAKALATRRG